ncbi:MAG: 3-methyl-2-oxobutanoate hydroxymethyltransferase [Gemmatimonadota bacterium]
MTTRDFVRMKERGEPIAVLTCYDHLFARILDASSLDAVLVGDSLGEVALGYRSTLPVSLEEMIHHASAVRRGLEGPLLVVDLPFLSFQVSPEQAVRSGGRVLKESGAEAVKLEGGGKRVVESVRRLTDAGIPVMGHLGLTPQSVHQFGGYGLRGTDPAEADEMVERARALDDAGCFSLVLEMVPEELAARITGEISIPTVGIGAGRRVDGQVLVLPDMLGLNEGFEPRFLRRFADLGERARGAVDDFVDAVKSGGYPAEEESYRGGGGEA